jgi:hypothetical protein
MYITPLNVLRKSALGLPVIGFCGGMFGSINAQGYYLSYIIKIILLVRT